MTSDGGTIRVYDVPDISCDHCKNAIEGEVAKVAGVTSVVVSVSARKVLVEGSAGDTEIRAAIAEAGYDIEGVTTVEPSG
jgi:copper chaperone CopZ